MFTFVIMMDMRILVTGGAGYIGSHTIVELITEGYDVVIVDNFSNSSEKVIRLLEHITQKQIPFYAYDVCNKELLRDIFSKHTIDAVIHFAGLKSVGESVAKPLAYYQNNLISTLSLCEVMQEMGVKKLIFSSSATVYGNGSEPPFHEDSTVGIGIQNPYGQTKFMIEQVFRDLVISDPEWQVTSLRYFNPVGAHESGLIGEDPNDIPNNLMPYVSQVAVGKLKELNVYGNDYDTPDGTGVRDYIHVVDLAKGHIAALKKLKKSGEMEVYNLGTGKGTSVLELVHAFKKASGKDIPYKVTGRRRGDVAVNYARVEKADKELGWRAQKNIHEACLDSWKWQSINPNGFKD